MYAENTAAPLNHKARFESTVLVVDADSTQLDSINRGLLLYGYHCLRLTDINAAIDLLNRPNGPKVDLLITDVTDPDSPGLRLIAHLRSLRPDLPIIGMCGLNAPVEARAAEQAGIHILRRPFTPQKLVRAVQKAVEI